MALAMFLLPLPTALFVILTVLYASLRSICMKAIYPLICRAYIDMHSSVLRYSRSIVRYVPCPRVYSSRPVAAGTLPFTVRPAYMYMSCDWKSAVAILLFTPDGPPVY